MIVQHRLFHFCKELCCCTRILKENEGTTDASPRFGIGKPMLINCAPHFTIYTYTGDQGVNRSRHAVMVKNCTKIYLRQGSAPNPAAGAYSASYRPPGRPSPRPPPASALRSSAHHSPSPGKKILRAPIAGNKRSSIWGSLLFMPFYTERPNLTW